MPLPLPVSTPGGIASARRILLVDADAFFVAVARLADPEGAGRARLLIVGGAPGSRGVVCSASYEARQYGVRSAMPIARALRLCPNALCVPVPRGACSRKSREISAVLHQFAPVVQAASIDEWYLDLSGTEALYHEAALTDVARRIREAVQQSTGLSVSLGGGTNKLVAKLAVEWAKPKPGSQGTGVFVVPPGEEERFMQAIPLAEIPGVGPRLRERLEATGLRSAPDAVAAGLPALQRLLGERGGRWLFDRARGIGSQDVVPRAMARSLSHEETFAHDVSDDATLEHELVRLVTRVASDLRAKSLAARTISIKLKDSDFRSRSASRTLDAPVVADRVILVVARDLLQRLRRARRIPARLLGVALSGLDDGDGPSQLSLFADAEAQGAPPAGATQPGTLAGERAVAETARDRALTTAVDALRARFGAAAIVPGRLAGGKRLSGATPPTEPNDSPAAASPRRGPAPGARRSGR